VHVAQVLRHVAQHLLVGGVLEQLAYHSRPGGEQVVGARGAGEVCERHCCKKRLGWFFEYWASYWHVPWSRSLQTGDEESQLCSWCEEGVERAHRSRWTPQAVSKQGPQRKPAVKQKNESSTRPVEMARCGAYPVVVRR
jgi:hypothetical protein